MCETAQDEGDADNIWGDPSYEDKNAEDDQDYEQHESFFVFMAAHEGTAAVDPPPQVSQVLAVAPQSAAGTLHVKRHVLAAARLWPTATS